MLVIHDEHDSYHGRNVERIVRETYKGPVAIVENPGNGLSASVAAQYIREWADKGAKVYNLSYGAGNEQQYMDVTSELTEALKYAFLNGMTVVFAGGNYPQGKPDASALACSLWSIDCGGLNSKGDGVGDYSQYHPALIEWYFSGYFDGAAGTSYAAPRLSAYLANVQQANNWELDSCQLRSVLIESARYFVHDHACLGALEAMRKPFLVSTRMKVAALYALYLQRLPDAGGYDYWTARVKKEGIYQMALSFKDSDEYRIAKDDPFCFDQVPAVRQLMAMYHLFLGREADPAGVAWWAEKLLKTQSPDTNIRSVAEAFIAQARKNHEFIDERLLF